MKWSLSIALIIVLTVQMSAQSTLDEYNAQYVAAANAYQSNPSELNLLGKAYMAFQLYVYHMEGREFDQATRFSDEAENAWNALKESDDLDYRISAKMGLGGLYYTKSNRLRMEMEDIPISDRESYKKARSEYNEVLNLSYTNYVESEKSLLQMIREKVAEGELDDYDKEQFTMNLGRTVYAMTQMFGFTGYTELYLAYQKRLESINDGNLELEDYPDLPEKLVVN